MTQPDELAAALQNPESAETPSIDYDALAEALTPIISAIMMVFTPFFTNFARLKLQ